MRLTVKAVPPFDFNLSAMISSGGDKHVRRYEARRFWQVIRVNDNLVLVAVRASGTMAEPAVTIEPQSDQEITTADGKAIAETVLLLFNLP